MMKTLALILLTFSLFAQRKDSVITVANEKVRLVIEQYTAQYCGPNQIKFVQDGAGNWIVGREVLTDRRYTFQKVERGETRETLRSKLLIDTNRERVVNEINIAELIKQYGQLIEYVPVVDSLKR